MFSDSIFESIQQIIESYLKYDNYSFYYREEVLKGLTHLFSILYKLDSPDPKKLPIQVFRIWAENELDKAVFQKSNCDDCLENGYCEDCEKFDQNMEDFKRLANVSN